MIPLPIKILISGVFVASIVSNLLLFELWSMAEEELLTLETQLAGEQAITSDGAPPSTKKNSIARSNPPVKHIDENIGSEAILHSTGVFNESADDLVNEAVRLLKDKQYSLALRKFAQVQSEYPVAIPSLEEEWMLIINHWMEDESQWLDVEDFFIRFLRKNPRHNSFIELYALFEVTRGKPAVAIDLLYDLFNSVDDGKSELIGTIHAVVDNTVDRLAARKSWQQLVEFSEKLLWHEPNYPPYLLVHARALMLIQQYDLAKSSVSLVVDDAEYGGRAQDLLEEIEIKLLGQQAIALQRKGRHYIVSGVIDDRENVELLLDTGASLSALDKGYFEKIKPLLQPTFVRSGRINTAAGTVNASIYRFKTFSVGAYEVADVDFVVLPMDSGDGVGLLGMNFLSKFDFHLDQQNALLNLKPPR